MTYALKIKSKIIILASHCSHRFDTEFSTYRSIAFNIFIQISKFDLAFPHVTSQSPSNRVVLIVTIAQKAKTLVNFKLSHCNLVTGMGSCNHCSFFSELKPRNRF